MRKMRRKRRKSAPALYQAIKRGHFHPLEVYAAASARGHLKFSTGYPLTPETPLCEPPAGVGLGDGAEVGVLPLGRITSSGFVAC
jgi:hypothetical protein